MHGRVKVITSEEQKARDLKVRKEKVKEYNALFCELSVLKNKSNNYDDLMKLTASGLLGNPDIATLWNIRKEQLLQQSENHSTLLEELALTQRCLKEQPKSYCTWHHRLWCLNRLPDKYWIKEMALCDAYLSQDERNFHCWNYRKIIVDKAKISNLEVFDFTTAKLEANFSNYSAWHCRTTVLPAIHPDPQLILPVDEIRMQQELEMVQSAVYTDPNDQSAWFYQRWLLGLRGNNDCFVSACLRKGIVAVAFSNKVAVGTSYVMKASYKDRVIDGCWKSHNSKHVSAAVWFLTLAEDFDQLKLSLQTKSEQGSEILDEIEVTENVPFARPFVLPKTTQVLATWLEKEIMNLKELLELEENNRWVILSLIDVMKAVQFDSSSQLILDLYRTLKKVDVIRANFYDDMISKVLIEYQLSSSTNSLSFQLCGQQLSSLYHMQYLLAMKKVDLSENRLHSNDLRNLRPLVCCEKLILAKNLITSLKCLPQLESLSQLIVTDNPLSDPVSDSEYLKSFPKLVDIAL